jgi:hypothetical protein
MRGARSAGYRHIPSFVDVVLLIAGSARCSPGSATRKKIATTSMSSMVLAPKSAMTSPISGRDDSGRHTEANGGRGDSRVVEYMWGQNREAALGWRRWEWMLGHAVAVVVLRRAVVDRRRLVAADRESGCGFDGMSRSRARVWIRRDEQLCRRVPEGAQVSGRVESIIEGTTTFDTRNKC